MKLRNLFLPSIALGAAILLATPEESKGFALLGHSLSTSQNDFRVFDNFIDSQANNNTGSNPNYPGYTGAVLALWKGCAEWSSEAHGTGAGDPHQGIVGSAGSSFDPIFNGLANSTGSIGNNIISALDQDGGGTLAFMQGGSSGWWIRFQENHTWADGPGISIGNNNFDLQSVGCHEYGHSVGLNHSVNNGSATMFPSGGSGSVSGRSINNDDALGMQAIYGIANNSGTKPSITQVVNLGSQAQIFGTNFTASNNQVWFTRLTPGSSGSGGNPIKVTGVSSTNGGTEIIVTVPGTAGAGDIMVKRNSSGQESTSAAWPFDPNAVAPPTPTVSSVSPSQITPLSPSGLAQIVITGTGFAGSTNLFINDKKVGDASATFTGGWTVNSDTQISATVPLTGSAGMVDIEFTTPGGPASTQVEMVEPSTPALAIASPLLVQAAGLSIATSAKDLDIVILQFSVVDGPTSIPGILELEIGNGNLNDIKKGKTWTIGPKYWRKLDTGPITGLPNGITIFFEGLVLPFAQAYDFPWDSTNKTEVFVFV